MYLPKHFAPDDPDLLLEVMRKYNFATLVSQVDGAQFATHVPVLARHVDGAIEISGHVARANPHWRAWQEAPEALLIFHGPHAYISPTLYAGRNRVPTWNYIAVHLRGELVPLPSAALEPHLNALSDKFESRLLPKPAWKTSKMSDGVMERMMRMILPFRLNITAVDGTWKLGQNKPTAARQGVIAALEARGPAVAGLAQRMRDLPEG